MDITPSGEKKSNSHHTIDPNPYFHFDSESHTIYDSVFNCRGVIINERFWNRIRVELMELTKDAGPVILYQLGQSYGFEVGIQGKDIVKDPTMAVRFLEYYGLLAGWGRFEAPELEKKADRLAESVTVKVYNNFFARATKSETGNPSCFFVSGLLAGVLEGLLGDHCNCLEIECMSTGSEYCEFIVAPLVTGD
jgi:predicted hydrocarbon binding protein